MKRLILLPVLFIFCLLLSSPLFAQGTLKCEEDGKSTIEIPMWLCYLRSDYDTVDDMIEQGQSDLEQSLTCDASNCKPTPDLFHCNATVSGRDARGIEQKDSSGYFCFRGSYEVTWSCGSCIRNKPKETEEVPVGQKATSDSNNIPPFVFTTIEATSQAEAGDRIVKLYPNPSNGLFNTQLILETEGRQVSLIVTDISGKQVSQKDYLNAPAGTLNTRHDLSNLADGLYLISVRVDNQIIGTSKVMVRRDF